MINKSLRLLYPKTRRTAVRPLIVPTPGGKYDRRVGFFVEEKKTEDMGGGGSKKKQDSKSGKTQSDKSSSSNPPVDVEEDDPEMAMHTDITVLAAENAATQEVIQKT